MVAAIVERGDLRDPALRAAFEWIPRHEFVPLFYDRELNPVSRHHPEQAETWLTEVYADDAVPTQIEDGMVVSSSSQPSLMAVMLEALGLQGDERVLEIGTGSGYNAALLCHLLGEYRVVTIDIDPEITSLARSRLGDIGYQPLVATGNGIAGYPARAPYQRIIATVGLDYIPPAWIEQLAPEGVIVAPLGAGVVRLERRGEHTAEGKFLATPAFFMPLRGTDSHDVLERPDLPEVPRRPSGVPASAVTDNDLQFLTSLLLPRMALQQDVDDDLEVTATRIWSADGSIAEITEAGVIEAGPRLLWSEVEVLHRLYSEHRRPERDRFGLTVTADAQYLWLDRPDGYSWALDLPHRSP